MTNCIVDKVCRKCGGTEFYGHHRACKICARINAKAYQVAHPKPKKARKRKTHNICRVCLVDKLRDEFAKAGGRTCKKCKNLVSQVRGNRINIETGLTPYQVNSRSPTKKAQRKAYRVKLRQDVFMHYSNGTMQCECCGESEDVFLSLDHIIPVGRSITGFDSFGRPRGGSKLYCWLRMNEYPEGFRILCHNCNLGRQINGGICPHVEAKYDNVSELYSRLEPLSVSWAS